MKLSDLPTRDLLRAIKAAETSPAPDPYAKRVLQQELDRRLAAEDRKAGREVSK